MCLSTSDMCIIPLDERERCVSEPADWRGGRFVFVWLGEVVGEVFHRVNFAWLVVSRGVWGVLGYIGGKKCEAGGKCFKVESVQG